jgi:hypothetical protein
MKIIVEYGEFPVNRSVVTVPDATEKHIIELRPVLAKLESRPALSLAEAVLTMVRSTVDNT